MDEAKPTRWIIFWLAWMGLIFYLSGPDYSGAETKKVVGTTFANLMLRISGHLGVYFVLCILSYKSFFVKPTWKALIISWCITVLYAAIDELHQHFVPGRHMRFQDWATDSIGALISLLFIRYLDMTKLKNSA